MESHEGTLRVHKDGEFRGARLAFLNQSYITLNLTMTVGDKAGLSLWILLGLGPAVDLENRMHA